MKLWSWQKNNRCDLILDTGIGAPSPFDRGLALCRSLTLGADRILLGPIQLGACPEFLCLSDQGHAVPAEETDSAAFLRFLAAAGYGSWPRARCGSRCFAPPEGQRDLWRGRALTTKELRELLSLPSGAP